MMLRLRFRLLLAEGQVWETLYSLKFYSESIERKKKKTVRSCDFE